MPYRLSFFLFIGAWCTLSAGSAAAQDFMRATVAYVDGTAEELTILADDYKHLAVGISVREADGSQRPVPAARIRSMTTDRDGFYRQVEFTNRSPGALREVKQKLARRIVEGEASLYRLDLFPEEKFVFKAPTDGGIHTYYLEIGEDVAELRAEESVKNGIEYRKDDRYLGTLKYLLRSCEQVTARLAYQDIAYTNAELARIVQQYNACGNDIPVGEPERGVTGRRYVFEGIYARVGVLRDKRFENIPASRATFGGIGVGVKNPRISRRTSLNLAVDFYRNRDTISIRRRSFSRPELISPVLSAVRVALFAEQELVDPRYLVRPFLTAGGVFENGDSYGQDGESSVKFHVGLGVKTDFLKLTVFNESIRQWNAALTVRVWPAPWKGRGGSTE